MWTLVISVILPYTLLGYMYLLRTDFLSHRYRCEHVFTGWEMDVTSVWIHSYTNKVQLEWKNIDMSMIYIGKIAGLTNKLISIN